MDQESVVELYFFSFYFSPFDSLFYPFLALRFHVTEKIQQVAKVIIVDLVFSVRIDVGNKHAPGILKVAAVNSCDYLLIAGHLDGLAKD